MQQQASGAFCMQGIETRATYDAARKQFIITTPQHEASKFWIGGAGQHGKVRFGASRGLLCTCTQQQESRCMRC